MTNDALSTLLPIAGWPAESARAVEITGVADPILPTPFRLGESSAATLAAVGLAVSDLWELRSGSRQEVAVDTRQATASLRSGHYMQLDGESPFRPGATLSRASILPRTDAGVTSNAISPTFVPPH